jgi:hypothetical protein
VGAHARHAGRHRGLLIGLGVAAGHAWLVDEKVALRPLGLTGVAFGVLEAVALARYGNELDWASIPAVVYVATLVALTVVSGWAVLPDRRRPIRPARAPTTSANARVTRDEATRLRPIRRRSPNTGHRPEE